MKSITRYLICAAIAALMTAPVLTSCKGTDFLSKSKIMAIEFGSPDNPEIPGNPGNPGNGNNGGKPTQDVPKTGSGGIHPIFQGSLGIPISALSIGAIDPDPTGHTICDDYDGDGIPNDQEGVNNPFVADYPQVVTGITGSITMQIRVLESSLKENHTETVELTEDNNTIKNSMEDWHYAQLNKKTTPYVSKESWEDDSSHSDTTSNTLSFGRNSSGNNSANLIFGLGSWGGAIGSALNLSSTTSHEVADSFHKASMSEKTVFPTIDHIDNLDRNGTYLTSDNIRTITENYRSSDTIKSTSEYGPNAGVVVASLYIKNLSLNIPVHVSNIWCTLSFRTQAGEFIPVKTFRLRNSDNWEIYEQDIYGGEVFGPYTVEVTDINTADMKRALANGYIPQIEVIGYDMKPVFNSNYYPGVENLKIVEENVKGRTAQINIIGKDNRESYRVCAFDVENGSISPGISLKKALYNIKRNRLKYELWEEDNDRRPLTVTDDNLWWKIRFGNNVATPGIKGNNWDRFETYVKSYTETIKMSDGTLHEVERQIETIKRIGDMQKYNPFETEDNPSFNSNELLSEKELQNMKYWVILHNGEFFKGDINDPIWVGDKYEIIFFDVADNKKHYLSFNYTPLQSLETNYLSTNWNRLSNQGEFARALYMGKLIKGDVVKLELDLEEYRTLFDPSSEGVEFGGYTVNQSIINAPIWYDFKYTFQGDAEEPKGMPQDFNHEAWGGCNRIGLKLTESENARYYKVFFWKGDDESIARQVQITPAMIRENEGYIFINRKSPDLNGVPIDAGDYNVRVKAYGMSGTVELSRSSNSGVTTNVHVTNPPDQILPGKAGYSLSGTYNEIQVNISESDISGKPAEFYRIRVKGPMNCPGETETVKFDIAGHAGINKITIPDAPHCGSVEDPDVFRVEVYSVNNNNIIDGDSNNYNPSPAVLGDSEINTILLPFERYKEQKLPDYLAVKRNEIFEPRDVDLEANFNDGSGWFKLKLSSNDYDENDRVIKCNYTANFDYDKKKVVIYFEPPAGSQTPQCPQYNVFRGNKKETDLYVRTVAKPEYRDSLWLKPNPTNIFNRGSSRFLTINATLNGLPTLNVLPGYDVLQYWIENQSTDATYIEDYDIGDPRVTAYCNNDCDGDGDNIPNDLDMRNIPDKDFRVVVQRDGTDGVSHGKNDFFFSPAKYMWYSLKGSIVSEDISAMMGETNHADIPLSRVIPGDKAIYVNGIDSQYATSFKISWRKGVPSASNENLDAIPWKSEIINVSDNTHYKIITLAYDKNTTTGADEYMNLKQNQIYTVCMTALNTIPSQSARIYKQVRTIPQMEVYTLVDPGYFQNGYGTFANPAVAIMKTNGSIFTPGLDFQYGALLNNGAYNVYDPGASASTPFNQYKYIRIVNNGLNVIDTTTNGLKLIPYAWDLSTIVSPPANQCYIDPIRGSFVLPRPVYWSRCENADNMGPGAEISSNASFNLIQNYTEYHGNLWGQIHTAQSFTGLKFGYGLFQREYIHSGDNGGTQSRSYSTNQITISNNPLNWESGTISFWVYLYSASNSEGWGAQAFNASSSISLLNPSSYDFDISIGTNQSNVCSSCNYLYVYRNFYPVAAVAINNGVWYHVYVTWKRSGFSDGKTLKIWLNGGNPVVNATIDIPSWTTSFVPKFISFASVSGFCGIFSGWAADAYLAVDNIKYFNHSIENDVNWEYNNGTGREGALHLIYGPNADPQYDYRPKLTAPGGVGFYCTPRW